MAIYSDGQIRAALYNAAQTPLPTEREQYAVATVLRALSDAFELDLDIHPRRGDRLSVQALCHPNRQNRATGRPAARPQPEEVHQQYLDYVRSLQESEAEREQQEKAARRQQEQEAVDYWEYMRRQYQDNVPAPAPAPAYAPNWVQVPQPAPTTQWEPIEAIAPHPANVHRRVIFERVTERVILEEELHVSGVTRDGNYMVLAANQGRYRSQPDGYLWEDAQGRQQLFSRSEWAVVVPSQCQMLPELLRYIAGTLLVRREALEAGRV